MQAGFQTIHIIQLAEYAKENKTGSRSQSRTTTRHINATEKDDQETSSSSHIWKPHVSTVPL
jgi:hypothetical protein